MIVDPKHVPQRERTDDAPDRIGTAGTEKDAAASVNAESRN